MRFFQAIIFLVFSVSVFHAVAVLGANDTDPLRGIDLLAMRDNGSRYTSDLTDGRHVTYTVVPELQRYADGLFRKYQVPAGAAVMLNSRTGRVLALAQQRIAPQYADTRSVALDPSPPAASLFKIVTLAALLEQGDVSPETQSCYAGGSRGLFMSHLSEPPVDRRNCVSLSAALGWSINAVFAKLSDQKLARATLAQYAERFGFNRELPFDVPLPKSTAEIPADRLERARTAAGFWHTHLSPVHAAVIMQSLAQKGAMLRPYIVERVEGEDKALLYAAKTKYVKHTVSAETASALVRSMTYTVRRGTARKAFYDKRGRAFLPGIDVAGKTGSLTGSKPYRAYSWFAGAAPVAHPEVAIAVLVVNEPKWRIKASGMAAMLLKKYFDLASANRLVQK
jgi:peptidoglycan glycosyltransferase